MDGYPNGPGWKESETARAAAVAIAGRVGRLRQAVLIVLRRHGPLTADEIALRIGESVLAVRPRVTELSKLGKIERTGERRPNASGQTAHVWRLVNEAEEGRRA
jgi:predicted ArsR family transcriptional regulator